MIMTVTMIVIAACLFMLVVLNSLSLRTAIRRDAKEEEFRSKVISEGTANNLLQTRIRLLEEELSVARRRNTRLEEELRNEIAGHRTVDFQNPWQPISPVWRDTIGIYGATPINDSASTSGRATDYSVSRTTGDITATSSTAEMPATPEETFHWEIRPPRR